MGLFQSIPRDVIQTNLVECYLVDYLDRIHLAMTCKDFWKKMCIYDPVTRYITSRNICDAIVPVAACDDFRSLSRLITVCHEIRIPNIINAACQKISSINHKLLRKCASIISSYQENQFDIYVTAWACQYYGGEERNIPSFYFSAMGYSPYARLCSAFALAGNTSLFNKYYFMKEQDQTKETDEKIAVYAGLGGNGEICNYFLSDNAEYVCAGIIKSEKIENIDILGGDYDLLTCYVEQLYATSVYHREILRRSMVYIKEKYPEFYKWSTTTKKIKKK